MKESDKVFAGSIPAIYDRYMVPLIFTPYANELAQRLADITSGSVLETAAGTGVVTRELARVLPRSVSITATDLNQSMIDFAARQGVPERVTWQQADALALPFGDDTFIALVCQFGVMFFPEKRTAFREARRVLKPGGRLLFTAWDRIEENDFTQTVTEAVAAAFPNDPPRFMARTPHGYHDAATIRGDLDAVGFTKVAVETVSRRSRADSPRDIAIGICQGTPLRNEIEARDRNRLAEVTDLATNAIAARFGAGPVDGKIQALVVTAVK